MGTATETAKIVRYRLGQRVDYGLLASGKVYHLPSGPWEDLCPGEQVASLEEVHLLAPCLPSKIVAVGRNYAGHAAELGNSVPAEPLVFLKPPSAVIGPGAAIVYPQHLSQRVDHEAELAVVVGRRARCVSAKDALAFVRGYTCANDVTARDLQERDEQWTRSKSFDTFCPLGPWIVPDLDVSDLAIRCRVNGALRQDGRTRDLVFGVAELLATVSAVMTLEPGDLLLTGTPEGIGPIYPGDRVAVEVEGIGTLENDVVPLPTPGETVGR
jgi:2-keto-4-pentenoate hydratase/2-oxohepta-3-ene-1,7-dioic acid hydratase in catechol pathway